MMKPRKPIRRVSVKRAEQLREYHKRVKVWKRGKVCAYCGRNDLGIDCHHYRGRSGILLLMEKHWIPVCRPDHARIQADPAWARKHGLLCEKGKWNDPR